MKMIVTAIALAIAAPAVAQTAPADPHANHAGHAAHGSAATATGPEQGPAQETARDSADPHAGHVMADCCSKDGAGQMACCKDKQAQASGSECCEGEPAEHAQAQTGHAMSDKAHAGHGSNHL